MGSEVPTIEFARSIKGEGSHGRDYYLKDEPLRAHAGAAN